MRRVLRVNGFSLIEIMVTVVLVGILFTLSLSSLRGGSDKAVSTSLAELTAEVLRDARQLAIADQVPVAVGFPSSGGTTSVTRSYYLLIGEDKPKIVDSRNFEEGLAPAVVFSGGWGTPEPDPPQLTLGALPFTVDGWSGIPDDAMIVFFPSGQARANRPLSDGAYRLLIAEGVETTGAYPHTAVSCASPRTVSVSPLGNIKMESGLHPSGVTIAPSAGENTLLGQAPPPSPGGTDPPVITSLMVEPDFSGLSLPSGIKALVREGESLTFVVRASDPDGGPLYASWSGPGTFSGPDHVRMDWKNGEWEGVWTWLPPTGGSPGLTTYNLECTIRDTEGMDVVSSSAQSPSILLARQGRILVRDYDRKLKYFTPEGLPLAEVEGLDSVGNLQSPSDFMHVDVASGGDFLVVNKPGDSNLYYHNGDGSGERVIFPDGIYPSLSPNGTIVTFIRGGDTIVRGRLDGTVVDTFNPSLGTGYPLSYPTSSPSGEQVIFIYYASSDLNDFHLGMIDLRSGSPIEVSLTDQIATTNSTRPRWPRFSPDGSEIVYSTVHSLVVIDTPTGTPPVTPLLGSERVIAPVPGDYPHIQANWSPDGLTIMVLEMTDHSIPTTVFEVRSSDGTSIEKFGRTGFDALKWVAD